MPRYNHSLQDLNHLIPGSTKTRKRGCSTSSSSSSVLQNYRFKRAILVGRPRGGSRYGTPAPSWRLVGSRSPASAMRVAESPKYAPSLLQSGKPRAASAAPSAAAAPVSARKLAATLWEMNEMPSPRKALERVDERRVRKEVKVREKVTTRSVNSGSLPPHLSDPSFSPVSERMDRSGTGNRRTRAVPSSQKLRVGEHNHGAFDASSNASFMEVESRSRCLTPSSSTFGGRGRLKDVSNALTTSKELLKIINRIWGHEDQPSSSLSLISALHAELERARLQVNQMIQEQRTDQSEINYLMKCFAEEKATWKTKERNAVEAAIESVVGKLEVERKLRRRSESLNKKLGRELAETKSSFLKAVKELEAEKRAREVMEQVCDDLAGDIGENGADEELKRESVKICEEAEKEREMLQLADVLREERVQMKLADAKYGFEENDSAVDKLRNELETLLRTKKTKEKAVAPIKYGNDGEIAAYFGRTHFGAHHQNDENKDDGGEVDDGEYCEEDSTESDLHSIELNTEKNNKNYKYGYMSGSTCDLRKVPINEEAKARKSASGKLARESTFTQRSISDGLEWSAQTESLKTQGDRMDWDRLSEFDKQTEANGHVEEMQRRGLARGLKDHVLSRLGPVRGFGSPTRQWGQTCPLREPGNAVQERPANVLGSGLKLRQVDAKGEGQCARRSRR